MSFSCSRWRRACAICTAVTLTFVLACPAPPPASVSSLPFIADGTITGLDGRDILADVDVEPNSGALGTPVLITISFSRGGADVAAIETWQAVPGSGWEFLRTPTDASGISFDPFRVSSNVWRTAGLSLTGVNGIIRYYAIDDEGARIALGDIDINGGRP